MCGDSLCLRIQGDVARGFMGRDRVMVSGGCRDSERLRAISERDWIVAPLLQSAPPFISYHLAPVGLV
jgi:hypothetical protein